MEASGEETALGQVGQEATCPLCLDLFQQPMVLTCGHNLCRDCLARLGAEASCPQCRARVEPGSACPNRALANIVGLVKGLRLSGGAQEGSSGPQLCREHQQPLQTFCSSEKRPLCASCLEGHQGHPLLSLPEAAQEYKDLLAEQEKKMMAEWVGPLSQLSGEASRLQQLIAQTERKCRQPDGEFLQDIQGTVDSCRSYVVGRVERVSPRLQGRTVLEKNASIRQMLDSYKASLQKTLTRGNLEQLLATAPAPQKPRSPKVCVKIDSSTAHPRLQCSNSSLTWADRYQNLPDLPGRFDQELCALGCEEFTAGWHFWEVSVRDPENTPVCGRAGWAIGVAKESVRRKGSFRLSPQEGIWAVGKSSAGEIVAFSKVQQKLSLRWPLRRLRVRLDYEAEKVEFLDAENEVLLYTFQLGSLVGERVRPFFYLGRQWVFLSL